MEKYGNKSPMMKFVHKNTGYIICGIILAVAIPLYIYETSNFEFFERWTCEQLNLYLLLGPYDTTRPTHDELTPEQHVKFHKVLAECEFEEGFSHAK